MNSPVSCCGNDENGADSFSGIISSNALSDGLMLGKGELGWVSFGPRRFPHHDDGNPLAKAREGGGRQRKRDWLPGWKGGVGHLRIHQCSDSECHSRLALLAKKKIKLVRSHVLAERA